MISLSAEAIIKAQARKILKNNFTGAVIALLILLVPYYIIDGTTTALSCAMMMWIPDRALAETILYISGYSFEFIAGFLFSPLINGYVRAYYRTAKNGSMDMKDVFYYFGSGHYIDALSLNIRLFIRMLLPIVILFSPLIIFDIFTVNYTEDFIGTILYNDFRFLLSVLSTTTTILYSLRYYTVFTLSSDHPEFSPKEVFQTSKQIMKHHTGSAAKLIFSFIPWLLLCLTVLPMLYVIPYLTMSKCVSAKWMTEAAMEENER